jgi:hypothetical protein
LQLSGIRDQLDSLLDEAARANLSARETLTLLCEREIACKDSRRIEMALKLAHFPAVKELAGFDFEAQPSIDPKQIRDLAAPFPAPLLGDGLVRPQQCGVLAGFLSPCGEAGWLPKVAAGHRRNTTM